MNRYGQPPVRVHGVGVEGFHAVHRVDLSEVMYYLYLPVKMRDTSDVRLPENVKCCWPLIEASMAQAARMNRDIHADYVYLSARKGWATPDNPLNRPGWHCDGFGTDDLNFVWWVGPGTRFAVQDFPHISDSHTESLLEFERHVIPECIQTFPERRLYMIDPYVVHATPVIEPPGCWRQYVKVSISKERYNLENNSHNYLFNYDWPLHSREALRNDPHRAQRDFK